MTNPPTLVEAWPLNPDDQTDASEFIWTRVSEQLDKSPKIIMENYWRTWRIIQFSFAHVAIILVNA